MNKGLEAIEARRALYLIERSIGEYGWFEKEELETELETLKTAIGELEELRKRNEPMKLKTKRVKVSIDDYRIDDYCPTCDGGLYTTSNYCPHCGQRLDWSE